MYSPNDWTFLAQSGTTGTISNQTIVSEHEGDIAKYSNQTASITTSANARVDLTFQGGSKRKCYLTLKAVRAPDLMLSYSGSAVYLYGSSGPSGGTADIYVDGQLTNSINCNNSAWDSYSALLYFRTDFDASSGSSHKLSVISTSADHEVTIDYALVSVLQPVTS